MGDAAHAESLRHRVFQEPFKVEPDIEVWQTPDNYRRFPGGDELPDEMNVWRVQDTGSNIGGVVCRSWGFEDSPDAEVLVVGYNVGKEYGAVGVGRHGNFLQWGYSAPPSKMTAAGRKLFLNCVVYIRKFDGRGPLIRRKGSDRINPIRLAMVMDRVKDKDFFSRTFSPELFKKYERNPEGLIKHYRDSYELIYWDQVYLIDRELESLGIKSNRQLTTLERLVELLGEGDREQAEAARRLLKRYTTESFREPGQWQAWLDENRDRIYFSDVGGYKFRVVPEGYLE